MCFVVFALAPPRGFFLTIRAADSYNVYAAMFICDAHNDLLTGGLSVKKAKEYLKKSFGEGLKRVTLAAWTTKTADCTPEYLARVFAPFGRLKDAGAVLFSVEDMFFVNESNLGGFLDLPIISAGLTWNGDNALAGGAYGEGGLTARGAAVVKAMQKRGIFLDTAHLSATAFYDVLDITAKPLICSHACFYELCPHPRNLSDRQIKAIIETGGIIGLALAGGFLKTDGRAAADDAARHIDYFAQNFGVENLCLGTDFFGTDNLPRGLKNYRNLSVLVDKLYKLGYNGESVEKVFYKNYAQFFS